MMKNFSLKKQLGLFLFLFLLFISFQEQSLTIIITAAVLVAVSCLTQGIFGFIQDRKINLSESALITGLLLGFVLSAEGSWWSYPAAAVVAILSKQIVRFKGRHIFNPAGFGALVALMFFGNGSQWHGASDWYFVIPFGLYFVYRIKRLPVILGYYAAAFLLYGGQALLQKTSFFDTIAYLNHFFIFIMLIEPKTSPADRRGMVLLGILASSLCFGLSFANLPLSGELPVLLLMNTLYAVYRNVKTPNTLG